LLRADGIDSANTHRSARDVPMLVVQILLSVGVGLIATALFGWAIDRKAETDEAHNVASHVRTFMPQGASNVTDLYQR